ncbi:ABC transporter substrate-binding protein [Acetobacterium sp.]|uniref:ABC transporter substrate-binding protein n=1 Tax=Acetobacterium sp. TaxID=1872094 RepID=UPI00359413C2
MKRIVVLILMVAMLCPLFAGCNKATVEGDKSKTQETVKIIDSRGKEVEVNYPAQKIVCLLNSALNDLYMLGAKDQIIAIDQWTYDTTEVYDFTAQIDERVKNKTLPAIDRNIEDIVALNPDVVVIWADQAEDIKVLEDNGIKVIGIQVDNFEDVYTKLDILGKISGKEERAAEIVTYTRKQLKSVTDIISGINESKKLSSLFVWGPSKFDLAGNNSTGDSIIEKAGGKNAADSLREEHFVATMEDVADWNPDTMLMWYLPELTPQSYYDDAQWTGIKAIQNKKVFELPHPFYCDLWTVKYMYSIQFLAKSLYPDEFTTIDLEKTKNDMLKFLYGVDFK